MQAYLLLTLRTERSQDLKRNRMTDGTPNREPKPEYRVFYRGYGLKVTQDQKLKVWTLSYSLKDYPPVISKLKWKNVKEAIDHGKRMIDSLLGKQDH
ncbi:hypothetical protein [Leptolyngbya sp. FACHB-671]|uniref:hypothetical protein n=1 Tax=Leptolyngbya sp. FACHB-671 TaxID=2692812 RepID=UPI0016894190|nr:hypothetical protein [Leptolyngbya sp. FACHB-671]